MATTVFRNRRTDRELETPATGYSSAIQTLFGWKIILQAHPGCLLEPAVPKTGVPQGYHCQLTLRRASPSPQEEQEMLTHRKGTQANFCPADLRVSETQDAGGNRCGWDRATHQELELLGCLVTEREERETKQKIHTLHQFRRWIGFLKHVSLSDKQNTHTHHTWLSQFAGRTHSPEHKKPIDKLHLHHSAAPKTTRKDLTLKSTYIESQICRIPQQHRLQKRRWIR